MKLNQWQSCIAFVLLLWVSSVFSAANPAMSEADLVSWTLFIQAVGPAATAGNNNVQFETWASDSDTFTLPPIWPGNTSSPKLLKVPALKRFGKDKSNAHIFVLPFGGPGEEVRRNKSAFDFIVKNNLHTVEGLQAVFKANMPISFPEEAIEIKANWIPATTPGIDTSTYHKNTASDGKEYVLLSMHVISKLVPNWTWATFEHKDNRGRCDYIGCRDTFGAPAATQIPPLVATPNSSTLSRCRRA